MYVLKYMTTRKHVTSVFFLGHVTWLLGLKAGGTLLRAAARERPNNDTFHSICTMSTFLSGHSEITAFDAAIVCCIRTGSQIFNMQDAQAAVLKLHAAGDDIEALTEAIQYASFLEEHPGDDRQKLRAAKARLRKLVADAAAGANAKDRSPHAKEVYDVAEFEALAEKFQKLNWRMVSKPGGATVKPDDFYRLYALRQQALDGDNTSERPMWAERGGLDFEGRARWDAWTALKGTDREKAKHRFVKLYYEFTAAALYKDTRGQTA